MKVKCYETEWEDSRDSEKRCKYQMLTNMLDADVVNFPGLKPRLMHIVTKNFHGSYWVVAIVVWE